MRAISSIVVAAALASGSCAEQQRPQAATMAEKPRLVLVISIDQFRADYVSRFSEHYLPASERGFNYLVANGANYVDVHHTHVPTSTGPGHAAILTGSGPSLNGIVGNSWFNQATGRPVYVVDDPAVETVGGKSKPMGPANLKVTTIGDELKLATNDRAKVVGVALKDRGSILLAGHRADTVVWFDSGTGNWVTSTHYAPDKRLPAWVQAMNEEQIPKKGQDQTWMPLLPADAYAKTRLAPFAKPDSSGKPFSHPVSQNWMASHASQEFTFDAVKRALVNEQLGKDAVTDVLAVNLATNDYVGHAYGPNSPEAMDISVRTDRLLSDLLKTVDHEVGLKHTLVVVTADHGVTPIPEEGEAQKLPVKRYPPDAIQKAIDAALDAKFGAADWVTFQSENLIYLNRAEAAAKGLDMSQVERVAANAAMEVTGVAFAITRSQILSGNVPDWPYARRAAQSFHPQLSGDLMAFESPGAYFGGGIGTGHGSLWSYDSHVPLLIAGPWVQPGRYARKVSITDLAPTIAAIVGVEQPSGSIGEPLYEALR